MRGCGHRILTYIYFVIRDGGSYVDKGGDYFDRLHPERTAGRLLARLEALDYDTSRIIRKVIPQPLPEAHSAPSGVGPAARSAEYRAHTSHG